MPRAMEDDPRFDPGFDRETDEEADDREARERDEEIALERIYDDPRTRPRED